MEFETLHKKRNAVMAFDRTQKHKSYLVDTLYDSDNHYQHFISVDELASTIDTLRLGDGKVSLKIADPKRTLTDITPGIFDVIDTMTSVEIKEFDEQNDEQVLGFYAMKQQKVVNSLSRLRHVLCCKALGGTYQHQGPGETVYEFPVGTAISVTATNKITATSSILDLTAQTEEQADAMLDPFTSKEDVRILCSKTYYAMICKIVTANKGDAMIQQISEPGVKINGWYYINDQAKYKDADKTEKTAVPEGGSIMVDKSVKSKFRFCDLALSSTKKTGESAMMVTGGGLPFAMSFDIYKGGFLMDITYMAAPIAIPCLSKIVHGLAQV